MKRTKEILKEWELYFISKYGELVCEICGRKLRFYNPGMKYDKKETVHFDHRNGGKEIIKGSPKVWLRSHNPTKENIELWQSCGFGLLCDLCNRMLPTKDREQWILQAYNYALNIREVENGKSNRIKE